jgi:hypothetical protein
MDIIKLGDTVSFIHWTDDIEIIGVVFHRYRVMDTWYLVVKTSDNCTYQPEESRCRKVD